MKKKFKLLSIAAIFSIIMGIAIVTSNNDAYSIKKTDVITNISENANVQNSFYIRGEGITQDEHVATVSATPGSNITFTLGMNSEKCPVNSVGGITMVFTNTTLVNKSSNNNFFIAFKDNSQETPGKMTFMSINRI